MALGMSLFIGAANAGGYSIGAGFMTADGEASCTLAELQSIVGAMAQAAGTAGFFEAGNSGKWKIKNGGGRRMLEELDDAANDGQQQHRELNDYCNDCQYFPHLPQCADYGTMCIRRMLRANGQAATRRELENAITPEMIIAEIENSDASIPCLAIPYHFEVVVIEF